MNYKLYKAGIKQDVDAAQSVGVEPQVSFVFDPANTDYQRFKQDIADGAELQNADGVVMTPEQVQQFMETLP